MMANFAYFLDFEFQTFFITNNNIIVDETLISAKFQDKHRHDSGDIRG